MKKILIFLSTLIFTMGFSISTTSTYATGADAYDLGSVVLESVEYFDDGSYATTTVYEESYPTVQSSTYNKTGSKTYVLRNKSGDELWRFTVHATFSVNPNVSSVVTNVYHTTSISDNAWQVQSAVTSQSGNRAVGDASFIRKFLVAIVETRNCQVILLCDKNGNLS